MPLIAVLDDDRKLWEQHSALLREFDIEVVQYVNKVDFLLEPPRLIPDAIVTDIRCPRMDGYEFLALVKQDRRLREVPVIVMTAAVDDDPECEPRALGLGAFAVLPRTQGIIRLLQVIGFAIRTKDRLHYN